MMEYLTAVVKKPNSNPDVVVIINDISATRCCGDIWRRYTDKARENFCRARQRGYNDHNGHNEGSYAHPVYSLEMGEKK